MNSKIYFFVLILIFIHSFFVNKKDLYSVNSYNTMINNSNDTNLNNLNKYSVDLENIYKSYGLINIQDIDSSIQVDIRYASTNNFLNKDVYFGLNKAYLQPDVAYKLANAQNKLKSIFPHYTLVVLDAARPASIQKIMWDELDMPSSEKHKYLAHPSINSLHNFGAAVDVTIATTSNVELDMGTEFDAFHELAYPSLEKILLHEGKLSQEQYTNRYLLRMIMRDAGFTHIDSEWWHFNATSRRHAQAVYPLIYSHLKSDYDNIENLEKYKSIISIEKSEIYFSVQIKSSSRLISNSSSEFKNLKVSNYYQDELYKYISGRFKSIEEARAYKEKLKKKGFVDAFIVAFNGNTRIGIKDAIELMN